MDEKFFNENVKIKKDNNIYQIEFKTSKYELINSLLKTRIIQGGSTDETYKNVYFKAVSVKTFKEYKRDRKVNTGKQVLLISELAKLIRCLVIQLNYLIEIENHTILGYNPEEILVINDEKFVYIGCELISKIDVNTDDVMISSPYSTKDFFFSPEMFKIKEIPSYIHFKTSYFSLGLLFIYALLGEEFYTEYIIHKNSSSILNMLNNHPIKNSRLFWLLSRCLVEEPKERSIIII